MITPISEDPTTSARSIAGMRGARVSQAIASATSSAVNSPVAGSNAAQRTVAPATGFPYWSTTLATSGCGNEDPTTPSWPLPPATAIAVAALARAATAKPLFVKLSPTLQSIADTARTLKALGMDTLVLRHHRSGAPWVRAPTRW